MLFMSVRISMSNGSKLMHLCSFCKVLRSSVSRSCRKRMKLLSLQWIYRKTISDILNLNKMSTKISQVTSTYPSTYRSYCTSPDSSCSTLEVCLPACCINSPSSRFSDRRVYRQRTVGLDVESETAEVKEQLIDTDI